MDVINDSIGLIDIKDVDLIHTKADCAEPEVNPSDALFVKNQWAKVNKDGTPDKRFKGNIEMPVYKYGRIELQSKLGLNESYLFSNVENSEQFTDIFEEYKAAF